MNIRIVSVCTFAAAVCVCAVDSLSAAAEPAKPLSQPAPAYSPRLRAAGVQGELVVAFTITKTGKVAEPVVISSTDRLLDGPTLAAVRTWTFVPATKDGVAVSVRAVQPVVFEISELHNGSSPRLVTTNAKPAAAAAKTASAN